MEGSDFNEAEALVCTVEAESDAVHFQGEQDGRVEWFTAVIGETGGWVNCGVGSNLAKDIEDGASED